MSEKRKSVFQLLDRYEKLRETRPQISLEETATQLYGMIDEIKAAKQNFPIAVLDTSKLQQILTDALKQNVADMKVKENLEQVNIQFQHILTGLNNISDQLQQSTENAKLEHEVLTKLKAALDRG